MKKGVVSKLYVLLIMLYLYVPILVLMLMGFNKSRYNSMPFEFSLQWYQELIGDTVLQKAAVFTRAAWAKSSSVVMRPASTCSHRLR